jgi:hypothetical protein
MSPLLDHVDDLVDFGLVMECGGWFRNGECLEGHLLMKETEEKVGKEFQYQKSREVVKVEQELEFRWMMADMLDMPAATADEKSDRLHDRAL